MSNTRRTSELHGGKLTRPKKMWRGRRRGTARSPYAAAMQRQVTEMAAGMTVFHRRAGDRSGD